MEVKMIIGIPIKNFEEAYTRLEHILSPEERSALSKALLSNIVDSFKGLNTDIYLITKDKEVNRFAKKLNISAYTSKVMGLSKEVQNFLDNKYDRNTPWCIIHSDLPYVNRFNAKQLLNEIEKNELLASRSEDNGTPIIGGTKKINRFHYGKNSFSLHQKEAIKINALLHIIFSKELSFEIDTEKNYSDFKENTPNWYT